MIEFGDILHEEVAGIAVQIEPALKALLLASNLGLSQNHRLAGWHILTILYHDGGRSNQATTLDLLIQKYNDAYLDEAAGETPVTEAVLKKVLVVLEQQAHLIESAPRKVRRYLSEGTAHTAQSWVYRITSSGIEYLTMMQRVVEAENTVTANITRIDEYCDLVKRLSQPVLETGNTQLYNDFSNMLVAYADVMKGMHKLDEDLDEVTNDLAFNHGSELAAHLQEMLQRQAVPAFKKLIDQGPRLRLLVHSTTFAQQVALSQQGRDNLDVSHALRQSEALVLKPQQMQAYVRRELQRLVLSFDFSSSAIDTSLDTVYFLFQTIMGAGEILSQEYEHIQRQTVDVKQLTSQLDQLMRQYQTVSISAPLPRHLALDRAVEDEADLLNATTMGPVRYQAQTKTRAVATEADNPQVVLPAAVVSDSVRGLAEFKRLVLQTADYGRVDHDLVFSTQLARDVVIHLYEATGYQHYESFTPFGRAVKKVQALPKTGVIRLQVSGESYSAFLPAGFALWLAE